MNDSTRNTFASYGLDILMRSTLLVLYEETDVKNVLMLNSGFILLEKKYQKIL